MGPWSGCQGLRADPAWRASGSAHRAMWGDFVGQRKCSIFWWEWQLHGCIDLLKIHKVSTCHCIELYFDIITRIPAVWNSIIVYTKQALPFENSLGKPHFVMNWHTHVSFQLSGKDMMSVTKSPSPPPLCKPQILFPWQYGQKEVCFVPSYIILVATVPV